MPAQLYSSIFYILFLFFVLPFSVLTSAIVKTSISTGLNAFVIVSNSMHPAIPIGSVIYTKKDNNYKKGDVITYPLQGVTISHRVEKIVTVGHDVYYSTKGDANSVTDFDLIDGSKIIGKTIFFLPFVGEIIIALRDQNIIYFGAVLPALLVMAFLPKALRF